MVEISEIVDGETLGAWLEDKPQFVPVAIASRAALRAWPLLADNNGKEIDTIRLILDALRLTLIASVSSHRPTSQLKLILDDVIDQDIKGNIVDRVRGSTIDFSTAVGAAFSSASCAYSSLISNTERSDKFAASTASFVARIDEISVYPAFRSDCEFLERNDGAYELNNRPLWPNEVPEKVLTYWADMRALLFERNEGWEVWFPIYEGFRDGTPVDWDVLEKIALLPDEDWREDDPAHTNGIIAQIFEEFAET